MISHKQGNHSWQEPFEDQIIDKFLTSYIILECHSTYDITHLSETKLQKLVFLSERNLLSKDIKALNYTYLFYKEGPFSFEVRSDFNNLKDFENINDQYFTSINNIEMILEDFSNILDRNQDVINKIDMVLTRYAPLDLRDILNRVYNLTFRGRKIRHLKLKTPLTFPITKESATQIFDIDEDELIELAECFDEDFADLMGSAAEDLKNGRILTNEEVFG